MLKFLDIFFVIFHTGIVFFNLFGWIYKKTRFLNLILLTLTGASWFILGIFYGIGYCPLTDWHFEVLESLGHTNLPTSYIKYMVDRLTGLNTHAHTIDIITMCSFTGAFIISVSLNLRDYLTRKK